MASSNRATGAIGAITVVLAPPWRPSAPRPHRGPHVVAFIRLSVSTGAAKKLETTLQAEVARYRGETFADNAKRTYTSHGNSYLRFCTELCVPPVQANEKTIAMYAAYLARRLRPASVRQYLNIVRVIHLEAGLK